MRRGRRTWRLRLRDRERAVHAGVGTCRERQDLQRDVRQPGRLDQSAQLISHDLVAADRATHHRFIEHHLKIYRIVLNQ